MWLLPYPQPQSTNHDNTKTVYPFFSVPTEPDQIQYATLFQPKIYWVEMGPHLNRQKKCYKI